MNKCTKLFTSLLILPFGNSIKQKSDFKQDLDKALVKRTKGSKGKGVKDAIASRDRAYQQNLLRHDDAGKASDAKMLIQAKDLERIINSLKEKLDAQQIDPEVKKIVRSAINEIQNEVRVSMEIGENS